MKNLMIVFVMFCAAQTKLMSMNQPAAPTQLMSMNEIQSIAIGCVGAAVTGTAHACALVGAKVYQYGLAKSGTEKVIDWTAVLTTAAVAGWKCSQDNLSVESLVVPAAMMATHVIGRKVWMYQDKLMRK